MNFSEREKKALSASPLFAGVEEKRMLAFLASAGARPAVLPRGSHVLEQGQRQEGIYIILTGRARGERLTSDGRAVTVNEFSPGELFGDVLSGADMESPVTVLMVEDGSCLRLTLAALLESLGDDRQTGERVLRNLIGQISEKYFYLMKRMEMVLCPTLRGKIAIYLLQQQKNGSNTVTIPHSREEQASFLGCDRSALSRELSRMKREGVIDFSDRSFTILNAERLKSFVQ